jgi:integrase/recombinase XerC
MATALREQRRAFLDHLAHERALSPRTVEAYGRDLEHLLAFLERQEIDDPAAVTEHHVRALVAQRHRQGVGGRSLQRLLSSLRGF